MSLLDYFRGKRKPSASIAKERLQIILAHEHSGYEEPDYLPALKREILEVVSKYVAVNKEDIQVNLEKEGNCEILELNISLPDHHERPVTSV